jgi:hypothetical protein
MTETIRFSKIGAEDICVGSDTFEVELSDGRRATLNKVNLGTFLSNPTDMAILYVDGTTVGQDADFTWDATNQAMVVNGGVTIGTTATPTLALHASVDGAAEIRIENNGTNAGDSTLSLRNSNDVTAWSFVLDDSNASHLLISNQLTPSATPRLMLSQTNGAIVMNDDEMNAFNTQGLTVQQGGADDECFALKSSDVAHGMTTDLDTDTYGSIKKASASEGGLIFTGATEGTVANQISGFATTVDTTANGSSTACIVMAAWEKTGTTVQAVSTANANLFAVMSGTNAKFIVDQEGDLHVDGSGSLTTFDDYDDMKLISAAKSVMSPDFKATLGDWLESHLDILDKHGVVTRDHERGGYFVSYKGLSGLVIDAMRQLDARINALECRG